MATIPTEADLPKIDHVPPKETMTERERSIINQNFDAIRISLRLILAALKELNDA